MKYKFSLSSQNFTKMCWINWCLLGSSVLDKSRMCNIMIQSRFRTRKPLDLLLRYITIPLCRLDFIALYYIYTYFSGVAIIILLASFSIYSHNILFIIVIYIFSFRLLHPFLISMQVHGSWKMRSTGSSFLYLHLC